MKKFKVKYIIFYLALYSNLLLATSSSYRLSDEGPKLINLNTNSVSAKDISYSRKQFSVERIRNASYLFVTAVFVPILLSQVFSFELNSSYFLTLPFISFVFSHSAQKVPYPLMIFQHDKIDDDTLKISAQLPADLLFGRREQFSLKLTGGRRIKSISFLEKKNDEDIYLEHVEGHNLIFLRVAQVANRECNISFLITLFDESYRLSSFVEEFNSLPLQGLRQRILSGRVGDFFSDAPRNISYYSTNESILFTYEFPKNLSGWNHSFEQFVASGYEDFEVTNLSSSLAKVNIKKNEGEEGLYNIIFQQDIAVGTLFTVKFSKKVKRS